MIGLNTENAMVMMNWMPDHGPERALPLRRGRRLVPTLNYLDGLFCHVLAHTLRLHPSPGSLPDRGLTKIYRHHAICMRAQGDEWVPLF